MKFNPHNYQKYVMEYIVDHPIAAVLLDMGLGKTAISLMALKELMHNRFEVGKVLVVAPLRVAKNTWPSEIEKWDDFKELSFAVAVGTAKQRLAALAENADITIINRENLPWLLKVHPCKFDMVVIDELSSFKNRNAERFKAMMIIRRNAKRIIGLTGTPSSNGLMDLWGEMKVLDFGQRLGRYITHYRNRYFVPDKRNGMTIFTYKPIPGAEKKIYDAISDITVSMRAEDYLEMPELICNTYKVKLTDAERKVYDELKKDMVVELGGDTVTANNAASLSNKLVQMANGAVYLNEDYIKVHDQKLDALEDMIEAASGKPVLVAYWYRHDLERIEERLRRMKIKFDRIDTDASIAAWNNRELQVGLIHPAGCGHGLNLQKGGSTMIWFGLTWSLELYQQTVGRIFRQGQVNKTVVVEHIVTEGTIDEQIMKALERKESTQNQLIDAVKAHLEV